MEQTGNTPKFVYVLAAAMALSALVNVWQAGRSDREVEELRTQVAQLQQTIGRMEGQRAPKRDRQEVLKDLADEVEVREARRERRPRQREALADEREARRAAAGQGIEAEDAAAGRPRRRVYDGIEILGEHRWSIPRRHVDYAVDNLDKLGREARVVPNFQDGRPSGFKIFSIRRSSIARRIGLKNNDVVVSVNGLSTSIPSEVEAIIEELKTTETATVRVDRYAEELTFTWDIRDAD